MSLLAYAIDAPPPLVGEVVDYVADRLRTDAVVPAVLGGPDAIFDDFAPVDRPPLGAVVRERVDVGGQAETSSGEVRAVIQVEVFTSETAGAIADVRRFHERVHDAIAEAIVGRRPEFDRSVIVGTGIRRTERPAPALYFEGVRSFVSVSEFAVTLKPKVV